LRKDLLVYGKKALFHPVFLIFRR